MHYALVQMGGWNAARGTNLIDGGAPFYAVYETADGLHVSVGAIEPKFFRILVETMGLDPAALPEQYDREGWPALREIFTRAFLGKPRAEWCALLEGTDACFAPVLTLEEARSHPQNAHRVNVRVDKGVAQPAPAPRFSGGQGPIVQAMAADRAELAAAWDA